MNKKISLIISLIVVLVSSVTTLKAQTPPFIDVRVSNFYFDPCGGGALIFDIEMKAGAGYVPGSRLAADDSDVSAISLRMDIQSEDGVTFSFPNPGISNEGFASMGLQANTVVTQGGAIQIPGISVAGCQLSITRPNPNWKDPNPANPDLSTSWQKLGTYRVAVATGGNLISNSESTKILIRTEPGWPLTRRTTWSSMTSGASSLHVNPSASSYTIDKTFTATDDAICSGTSATLTVAANPKIVNPTYKWYTAETGGTLRHTGATFTTQTLTADTTYYVTVATCTPEIELTRIPVTVTTEDCTSPCTPATAVMITAAGTEICFGSDVSTGVTLTASSSITGANKEFNWYADNTTATTPLSGGSNTATYTAPTSLSAGTHTYYVSVKSDDYCENLPAERKAVTITVKPAIIQDDPAAAGSICSGTTHTFTVDAATGGNGTFTYNWQQSTNGTSGWANATGTRNAANYTTQIGRAHV